MRNPKRKIVAIKMRMLGALASLCAVTLIKIRFGVKDKSVSRNCVRNAVTGVSVFVVRCAVGQKTRYVDDLGVEGVRNSARGIVDFKFCDQWFIAERLLQVYPDRVLYGYA